MNLNEYYQTQKTRDMMLWTDKDMGISLLIGIVLGLIISWLV